jgi:hypothetical protein
VALYRRPVGRYGGGASSGGDVDHRNTLVTAAGTYYMLGAYGAAIVDALVRMAHHRHGGVCVAPGWLDRRAVFLTLTGPVMEARVRSAC